MNDRAHADHARAEEIRKAAEAAEGKAGGSAVSKECRDNPLAKGC